MSTVILDKPSKTILDLPEIETKLKGVPPSPPKRLEENPVCLALEDLAERGIFVLIYPQDLQGERYFNKPDSAKIYPFTQITPKILSERLLKVGARYNTIPRQTLELESDTIICHNYESNAKTILFDRIPEDLRNYREK